MSVSSVQSGYALINQSQNLAKEAANEIAQKNSREDLEFNKLERPSDIEKEQEVEQKEAIREEEKKKAASYEESLVKLNQAQTYNQAGVNVVQRSNEVIGTLLDTHV
ncbi:hypothetical protein [Vibrio sp. HN007]|uniref:hypothetical protein n=1 Tax=Vibrio iocasae TaxID=3098914 RepID=UPI0035D4B443